MMQRRRNKPVHPEEQQQVTDIHIEELILHGFQNRDQVEIAHALERELSRIVRKEGVPPSWTNGWTVDWLDGGEFEAEPDSPPERMGEKVAQALYRRLG